MPRTRRYIESNSLYEITFRARDSLPFPCTDYMELIIKSVLARVQDDDKVILHHYIFEGSHPHIFCTARDADQCQRFYGQLEKQLTDSLKRLTGVEHLSVWEGRATVIKIPTLDDAVAKIGYLYSNPSNDDLETSIERYPGVNSWKAFLKASSMDEEVSSEHGWIRQPMIPKLPSHSIAPRQDKAVCKKMLSQVKKSHVLRVYPHAWIKHFIEDPSPTDMERVKQMVLKNLRDREAANALRRERTRKSILGVARLRSQPLLKPHRPKKTACKIFAQSMFKDVRQRLIAELKYIDNLCRQVYERWKRGDFFVPWPPGTFPPPLPPMASALSWQY